jgi:hypothetical protein
MPILLDYLFKKKKKKKKNKMKYVKGSFLAQRITAGFDSKAKYKVNMDKDL